MRRPVVATADAADASAAAARAAWRVERTLPVSTAADPLERRTRTRPDHNRVRDVPSHLSLLGLAPPPP